MDMKGKRILLGVLGALAVGGFYGFFLFIAFVMMALSGWPVYVQHTLWFLGAVTWLAAVFGVSGLPRPKGRRVPRVLLALVLVGSGAVLLHGLWRDNLATVDDRSLLLRQYEPFAGDTKAVSLDGPASLRLEHAYDAPRLDGATALYPVYAAFVQAVYPEGDYPLYGAGKYERVTCSGTVEAYQRLIRRETDIIFAAAPSQEQLDMAAQAGMELHLTPIGREAFVFFVNSRNPVTGLTVEEIQGIYSGELTDWSQVGGRHQKIRPFQRAANSGSQSALLRLMEGKSLLEPEEEDVISAMDGIIRQVASYRNYRNAIGFSFRFYATEMVSSGEIRLLALNGVEPTRETIRDGSYPISSSFYAVTAAPKGQPALEERNPQAADFLRWILSEEGQELVERSGYVAERGD